MQKYIVIKADEGNSDFVIEVNPITDDEIESMIDFAIDRDLDIRFIETMPIGLAGIEAVDRHYSEKDILERV